MLKKRLFWGGVGVLLSVGVQAKDVSNSSKAADSKDIESHVSRAIATQLRDFVADDAKQGKTKTSHRNRGYAKSGGTIYLLPHWPYYTQFFDDNDLVQLAFNFDTASQAYAGRGGSQDLSKLIFGQQPVLIKEILLTSKLVDQQKLIDYLHNALSAEQVQKNHFLGILAGQDVGIDASLDRYHFMVDYARHFRDGDLTIGFHLPLVLRRQHLRMTNDISDANLKKLNNVKAGIDNTDNTQKQAILDATELRFNYANLEAFVSEILRRKNMCLNGKESVFGLGDVVAYANLDIPSHYFDRFVAGISLLVPTASVRDSGKLWYADLGNGGFVEVAGYGSWLWQTSRWFNPYVHMKATYSFAASVNRRVPMVNTFDGTNFNGKPVGGPQMPVGGRMIFGETLGFRDAANGSFSEPDSTVRCFADNAKKVKVNPGPSFTCRFGNTFDAIFSYKGFVDIFYDLLVKGKDYISHRSDDGWVTSILGHNTSVVSHTAGLTYTYQFDEQLRGWLGMNYVFAGRNTPKTFGVEAALNIEF